MKAIAAKRVVTCVPQLGNPLGVFEDAAVVIDGAKVHAILPRAEVRVPVEEHGDVVITPGLVDAHTHAAWVGSRHDEYVMRMEGADYRAIAAAGGGILASHRAVAGATVEEIASTLEARLRRMAALGVTTCEVKSGYGLEPEEERKQLLAIARASGPDLPLVVPTFLALHALPPSVREGRMTRAAFVENAAALVTELAPLARFVDAYVDDGAFTVDEARRVCEAARKNGLDVRMHVGQFADIGGAELAAELGARSIDHAEHIGLEGILRLVRAGTAVTLLPTASFTLGQAPPPIDAFRDAGIPLVVASDANPGTAPSESLPLAMAFAVRLYGLTPAETLLGATVHAARSLGLEDRGHLGPGSAADLVVWDLPHENALIQPWGTPQARAVFRDGRLLK